MAGRRVVVDGLNLAYWCGAPPTLRLPLALIAALLRRGDDARIWFDASAPHRLAAEAETWAALAAHPEHFAQVPSGRSADAPMLREARDAGATLVSRDRFHEHRRRFRRLIDDPARLVDGHVAGDRLRVPALAIDTALPATAALAWAQLRALLAPAPRARGASAISGPRA